MQYDREKVRRELLEAQKDTLENKGAQRLSIFNTDVRTWQCEAGSHRVDILPWDGGKNISAFNPKWVPGKTRYVLPYFVHYDIGVGSDSVICRFQTVGEPCPVCEQRKVVESTGEGNVEDYYWKKRTLYNILCHDNREELSKGAQVWDVAEFFMQQHLKAFMEAAEESGEILIIFDPIEGKQVSFTRKGTGRGMTKFMAHQLLERDYEISPKILSKVYTLDEIVRIPSYEEVYKKLHGVAPAGSGSSASARQDEEILTRLGSGADTEEMLPRKTRTDTAKSAQPKTNECPFGGDFGVDFGKLKKCDICTMFDACQDAVEAGPQVSSTKKLEQEDEDTGLTKKRERVKRK